MSAGQRPWTVADVPDQSGRTVVVTGANPGIGFEVAAVLARRGANTILACRDTGKAKSAPMGALPALRAATDPAASGGEYYGPGGPAQIKGYPVRVSSSARSRDEAAQRRLWAESERLTGVSYPVPGIT